MEKTKQIADLLLTQHAEKKAFSNLNGQYQPVSTEEAYMAQHEFQKRSSRGPIGGFKIALASIVQQELCGINHPIAGGIFFSDIHHSPHKIYLQQYHGLGLEFELAFKISKTIWSDELKKEGFNLLDHVDEIYPAFELIIDRNADYTDLSALTLIADNAWSGGVVLGNSIKNWQSLDFYELKSTLYWNNETPVEAKIIDANPLTSLEWVINHLGNMGLEIPKDSIIITGSVLKTRKPLKKDKVIYKVDELAEVEVLII